MTSLVTESINTVIATVTNSHTVVMSPQAAQPVIVMSGGNGPPGPVGPAGPQGPEGLATSTVDGGEFF